MLALGDLHGRPGAAHGNPDRWMGLLERPRPDVDLAEMEPTALEIERTFVVRPGLHNQVVGFPQLFGAPIRIGVGRCDLIGDASDEAALQSASGQDVDIGHLFGDANRLFSVDDRITEYQEPRLLGLAGQNSKGNGAAPGTHVAVW